jgi:hypothetical protein
VARDGTRGWQLGELDLREYLDYYCDQRLVRIIALLGDAEPATYVCGVCRLVMNEVGECPRRKLAIQEGAVSADGGDDTPDVLDQVDELLCGLDGTDALADEG